MTKPLIKGFHCHRNKIQRCDQKRSHAIGSWRNAMDALVTTRYSGRLNRGAVCSMDGIRYPTQRTVVRHIVVLGAGFGGLHEVQRHL